VLFNLPEYRVLATVRDETGRREVFVETPAGEAACPSCGVLSNRVHQRTQQRIRDVPFVLTAGLVTVWWIKKRWRCGESRCGRATFTESTDQVPPRTRLTTRLKDRIVAALSREVRAVDRVAGEHGIACLWLPTAMRQLTRARAEHVAQATDRPRLVRALGIDEHRFRSVRWYRDDDGTWQRVEPCHRRDDDVHRPGHRPGHRRRRRPRRRGSEGLAALQAAVVAPPGRRRRDRPLRRVPFRREAAAQGAGQQMRGMTTSTSSSSATTCSPRSAGGSPADDRTGTTAAAAAPTSPAGRWAHRLLLLRGYDSLSPRGGGRS